MKMPQPDIRPSHCNLQAADIAAADIAAAGVAAEAGVASEAVVAFASRYAKASALALSASQQKRGFSPWGMTFSPQLSISGDDRVTGRNR
jgi:hypothetical protein